jgi:hypothetical protein
VGRPFDSRPEIVRRGPASYGIPDLRMAQHGQKAICYTPQRSCVRVSGGPQPVIVLPTLGIEHDAAARPIENRLPDSGAASVAHADYPTFRTLLGNRISSGIAAEGMTISLANRT